MCLLIILIIHWLTNKTTSAHEQKLAQLPTTDQPTALRGRGTEQK